MVAFSGLPTQAQTRKRGVAIGLEKRPMRVPLTGTVLAKVQARSPGWWMARLGG